MEIAKLSFAGEDIDSNKALFPEIGDWIYE